MLGLGATTQHADLSWNPSFLRGAIHWWRKGHVELDAEGDITKWINSLSGSHWTQDGSGSSSPILSGDEAVKFDVSSVSMNIEVDGAGALISLGAYDIYIRMKFDASTTINNEDVLEKDGSNFFKIVSPTALRYKFAGERHDATINAIDVNEPFTLSTSRDSGGNVKVYVDAAQGEFDEGEGVQDIGDTFDFNILGKPSAISYWYEIVICDSPLNATDQRLMLDYLSKVIA